jgi:hypothetical protein
MMKITEYTKAYDLAISAIDTFIEKIYGLMSNMTEDEIILSAENYPQIIHDLYAQRVMYVQLRVRYLFDKMSKQEFEKLIQSQQTGLGTRSLTVDYEHVIKDYETPQKIATMYGITVPEIFLYNNINIEQFDDLKERNGVIKIPTTINPDDNSKFTDLAIYGSVAGNNAWGVDWSNDVKWNDEKGDFEKLSKEETLNQGLLNFIGSVGDIPLYPETTIEVQVSTDLPADAFDALVIAQLENKIPKDVRYKKVTNVQVQRVSGGRKIYITVLPINLENPLKPVEKVIPLINK